MSSIELTICTYNRPEILQVNFEQNIQSIIDYGMMLSVYDSSTNDDTKKVVDSFNTKYGGLINYRKFDSSYRVDEKVLTAILDCRCKYSWPIADASFVSKNSFMHKISPYIDKNYDFVCLYNCRTLYDGKIYNNSYDFVYDCFWHATWLGGIVFKKELFNLLYSQQIYDDFLWKYNKNDGFSYLGIFYDLIARKNINAVFSTVDFLDVGIKKKQNWLKRYLEVWCYNLCYFVDSLDNYYDGLKNKVLRETWKVLNLDKFYWNYRARLVGGLNEEIYNYYNNNGYLDRVTYNKAIINYCAKMPIFILKLTFFLILIIKLPKKFINKLILIFKKR